MPTKTVVVLTVLVVSGLVAFEVSGAGSGGQNHVDPCFRLVSHLSRKVHDLPLFYTSNLATLSY